MGSYSDWITGRRNTYKTAITNAYNAHQASSGNDYETAYDAMNADSDVRVLIPPQNNTAFYGSSPNATEEQINTLQTWLQANPTQAGRLNLAAEATASDDTIRKSLGGAGNVGTEKRRWKGNPLYTFGNGIVVGKSDKIVAAIGTNGGNAIDGFGTDTLVYFDGIPFSKGTGLPGTAVFAGDLVVSGSIQGTGGIVIIDDVIQLERGVSNPAGIGVDDTGKIRLRHRGQGFLDLVDEVEKAKSGSIEDAKLWVGTQNTNSARWGNSLIPNSNFSLIRAEGSYTSGNYVERPAGVISAGTTSEIVTLTDGIATFAANGQGIIMQAIPIDCERYTVRIRYKGSTAVTPSGNNQAQGLFLAFHETSDDDATIDGKSFIYDNATPATNTSDNSNVHTGNVTVKYPTSLRSTDNSTHDGAPIPTSYTIRSYTYEPTAGTKNASLVIHASNYGSGTLDIDYVVLTENPKTTAEINGLITTATAGIEGETGSLIPNAVMTDKTKWAAIGGASLAENANGGDGGSGDAAIEVTTSGAGQGITSSAIDCAADRYLVGIRIKTTSGTTNISIAGVETAGPFYGALGDSAPTLVPGASDYRTKPINVDTINGSGQPSGSPAATKSVGTSWTTIIGTYEPNRLNPTSYAIGYTTPTGGPAHILPGKFSLAIRADSACTFVIDYVFAQIQTASINLAQALANSAYGDSQTFITAINDLLIKESGSIITNASMALPSNNSNGPAGYRARGTNAVIATVTDSEGDKQVKVTSSESEGVDRVLISPPFALGQADKFSIGVRCKSLESGDVDVSIAIALTDQTSLPSGKVTYAASGGSDVYTTSVTESQLTIDDGSNTQGGDSSLADQYDWAVGTSYENVVGTFQRKTVDSSYSKKSASVVITANGDFEVDYIFVKEQVCSFDLAETTAEDKRDEAIAQATGALQGMTNSLGQESGSLLANASFGSYIYDGSAYQIPKNWAKTRSTTRIQRVVGATEAVTQGSQTVTPQGEDVDAINQVGACALVTTGGNINGILSSYFQLPYNGSTSNTGLGKYTIGLRLKVDTAETVGIRILAHEASTPPSGSQEFILCTSSGETAFATGTARASTIHSDHTAKTYTVTAGSTGSTAQIALINISQEDTDVGYLSDDYIEYFPVDNAPDTQGDTDATVQNETAWYALAGTYTPSSGAQYVSFEIIIEDQDTGDSDRANVYIDYVSLVPQTVDADFASTIATARTEDAIDNIEDDPPQQGELIANPFFISSNKTQTGGYPKKWLPYGGDPPFSVLSFVNTTLKRGLHVAGTDSTHAGVFSRPFRTSSDDYEIKVRAKRSGSSDTDAKLEVYVYEYNSDIPDTVEAIISSESHVPSSKTVAGGHVVLSDAVQTMAATSHSNDTDPGLGTSYATYTYEYIPADACRYASILVRTDDLATTGFDIAHVSCVVDNTKTGNRLFGAFRGKTLNQLDLNAFGDVGNLRGQISANTSKTTFPGFGDAGFAVAVGNLNANQFPTAVQNGQVTLTSLGGIGASDIDQSFIEGKMPSGWTAAASLNSNVDIAANLGYTPMNSATNISAMTGYSAINTRITANDNKTGISATQASQIIANNAKVGWANQYTNADATSAAAGMNLTDFSNFGNKVKGVTQYVAVNPYKNYAANGDFKLMTDSDAYIDDQSVDQGVYPTGCWFGSTNFGTTPNDTDGDDGGSQLGSYKGSTYSSSTYAGRSEKYTGGYDSSNISHTPPSWYFPKINEHSDGNYINLAAFGHGITFSAQKISGGAKVKVKFQAKCAVRTTGALYANFWVGNQSGDRDVRQQNWMHLPNSIEGALTVTVQGYANEEDKDFYISTATNAECPANRSATYRTVDGGTDEYIAQKTVTVTSTSWATYTASFTIPDDLEAFSISIGRKANWTSDEFLTACPTWQHDESPHGFTGNGTSTFTVYADKGETYYSSYLNAATNTSGTTATFNSNYIYGAGWEVADINSRLIAYGGGVKFNYTNSASWTSSGINNDANYISIRNVEAKEVSGLTLSAMVSLKTTNYTLGSGGFRGGLLGSDKSFKQDIEPASDALEIINQLPVSRFRWIPREGEEPEDMNQIPKSWGMIAQDVENVHETFVGRSKRTSGIKLGLHADELIALSIKAMQEQQEIIESQRKDIDDLKELVNKLIEDKGDNDGNGN